MSNQFDTDESALYTYAFDNRISSNQILTKRNDDGTTYFIPFKDLYTTGLSLNDYMDMIPEDREKDGIHIYVEKNGLSTEVLYEINEWYKSKYDANEEYSNIEDLRGSYNSWINKNAEMLLKDFKRYEGYKEAQQALASQRGADIVSERITKRTLLLKVKFDNDDPKTILRDVIVSLNTPIFVYRRRVPSKAAKRPYMDQFIIDVKNNTDDEVLYTKVIDQNESFNHGLFPLQTVMTLDEGYYLQVYTGQNSATRLNDPSRYTTIAIDVNGSIKVNVDREMEPIIIERIKDALPNITFVEAHQEIDIKATFDIDLPLDFSIYLFYHTIMTDKFISFYLSVDELSKILPFNKRHSVKFDRNISIGISRQYPPSGKPYLHCSLSSVSNTKLFNTIKNIMSHIIGLYSTFVTNNDLYRDYNELFPLAFNDRTSDEIDAGDNETEGSVVSKTTSDNKLKELMRRAPRVFAKGYGTSCQKNRQPVMITREEAVNGTMEYLEFPANNPQYYFICPYDGNSHPGIQHNKTSTKDEYPYLPCCFATHEMHPSTNSLYNEIYRGNVRNITESKHVGRNLNLTSEFGKSNIPTRLNSMLRSKIPDIEGFSYYRMGAPDSPSSILHIILDAFGDVGYLNSADREEYVEQFRRQMSNMPLGVGRQETWFLDDTDLKSKIADPEVFFDPLLFIRLIEERFRVNLFIIPISNKTDSEYSLAIPNHRSFYAYTRREYRPSIIVFRNASSEEIRCELLIYGDKLNRAIKIFGQNMTRVMSDLFEKSNEVITFNFKGPQVEGRKNMHSVLQWIYILQGHISSMFLDSYGKMRGVNIWWGDKPMSVMFPPAQPENLPVASTSVLSNPEDVIKAFGKPIGKTVGGLWFSVLDIEDGIFIPTTSTESIDVPIGPISPFSETTDVKTNIVHNLRRYANVIIQLLRYTFDLYRYEIMSNRKWDQDEDTIFKDFMNKIVVREVSYNFSRLSSRIPILNFNETMKYLSDVCNFVTSDLSIAAYSDKFRERLIFYLKRYYHDTKGSSPKPDPFISFNLNESDFVEPGTQVFLSEDKFDKWVESKNSIYSDIKIHRRLEISMATRKDPFIFNSVTGVWYIIQNSKHKYRGAIAIAKMWRDKRYNPGPDYEDSPEVSRGGFIVYTITTDGQLTGTIDRRIEGEPYVSIITYDPNNDNATYGAMLKLLP